MDGRDGGFLVSPLLPKLSLEALGRRIAVVLAVACAGALAGLFARAFSGVFNGVLEGARPGVVLGAPDLGRGSRDWGRGRALGLVD